MNKKEIEMKKILNVLAIVAIVLFACYNVYKAQQPVVMSDIAMENVEALADMECQGTDGWQQLKYEYYSLEVPSTWVFRFGGADQSSIHKRNIRVKNSKGERVEYELGTLNWGTEIKKEGDFERHVYVEIRSFRKTSGDAVFLHEVGGKVPEASWPEWLAVQTKEEGGTEGSLWKSYLLTGESQGFSVTTGAYTTKHWEYKFFVEKNGMVYCLSVSMPDIVRSSSPEYDKMARRIIQGFKAI